MNSITELAKTLDGGAIDLDGYELKIVSDCQECGTSFDEPVVTISNSDKAGEHAVICNDCKGSIELDD